MRRAGFIEAAVVAFATALAAGAAFHALCAVLPPRDAVRAVALLVGAVYAGYLLLRSPRRDGRVLAGLLWLAASGLTALLDPPFVFHVLVQLLMFWLIRALCHHRRVAHGLIDACIGLVSLAALAWAFSSTGSVALAVWSALLCQALFTLLGSERSRADVAAGELAGRFERARRGAEVALRRVSAGP